MTEIPISATEKEWLKGKLSESKVRQESPYCISGILTFDMVYDEHNQQRIINPDQDGPNRIQDSYHIQIDFVDSVYSTLPQVRELAGRIIGVANTRGLKHQDMHFNHQGTACLCHQLDESNHLPSGFNVNDFFYRLLIPFFYAQSFSERFEKWPWGEYSHGEWGLFEWYLEVVHTTTTDTVEQCLKNLRRNPENYRRFAAILDGKKPVKGHLPCLCGSGRKIRDCHPRVLRGIWKLREDIAALGLKV